jgi:hypothetical protein
LLDIPDGWVKIMLGNIAPLKGSYAIRIYEMAKQWERKGSFRISLAEFNEKVGSPYTEMRRTRERVIGPAILEINEKTDISIGVTEHAEWGMRPNSKRRSKEVVSLTFSVRGKGANAPIPIEGEMDKDDDGELPGLEVARRAHPAMADLDNAAISRGWPTISDRLREAAGGDEDVLVEYAEHTGLARKMRGDAFRAVGGAIADVRRNARKTVDTLRLAKAQRTSAPDGEMANRLARLAVASDEEVERAAARCTLLGSGLQDAPVAEIREAVAGNSGMLIALVDCMDRD